MSMKPLAYRLGMSAIEARNEGLNVPDDVPDCAELKLSHDEDAIEVSQDSIDPMKMNITVAMHWSWVDFTLTVTPEEASALEQSLKENLH